MAEPTPKMEFHGMYCYATGDMFCGTLDVTGKPSGRGILYYYYSGECDVSVFDDNLNQKGEGVRYTKDRDAAYRLVDGQLEGGQIDLEEALRIMEMEDTPAVRTFDTIPNPTGYDPARHKQVQAYYSYRMLAGLPLNESNFGPSPYLPVWRKDEVTN
mmetsp:Transcript_35500/g.110745  ORF Transcript_35500/g.110745 Transcript_35500/m.110745 type:complete len:157 (+) Transcript_35500:63-533(+)|eukprot:CAMPEP_0204597074 /NCGR_PEP_ID=MMETSP0661-20131031/53602_1 /ASSEMBLY_ACC=CAM_ASM_000606 /TAXON_ID=109239 /ORGANISM="Alexandrium margalefi, Strain AMGDE01CS-322" /LENGTH=156 /DNA_ID=CAMNT_0051607747 /DNA_START=63 /DNA_END=533 /DNA_ORIENTATION=+